jgi:Toprim domain
MFTEDELGRARAVSVLEIAERHGARLKRSGHELIGPCPVCDGVDRFAILPAKNIWNCRGYGGGDVIDLQRHLSGGSFVDAVRALIGKGAETTARRQPTPDEIAARATREAERKRAEAEERARNNSSAAKIIASLQPVIGTPGEPYLRDVRKIDVSHWAIKQALESIDAIGWCERTYVKQPDPTKPLHPHHGQHLGAIIGILTDPVTGDRTGGITRTYLYDGKKVDRAVSLGGIGLLGIIRLSPNDEVGTGLHLCEGIESALAAMMMGFCPMWAAGSTTTVAKFPVVNGIESLTVIADNDVKDAAGREAGQQAAREVCQRWADAGREAVKKTPKALGEDANDIIKRRACS